MELKWQREPLMDQAIIARGTVPKALIDRIAELLTRLHETPEGLRLLTAMDSSRFQPASDASYDKALRVFNDNADLIPSPLQQP